MDMDMDMNMNMDVDVVHTINECRLRSRSCNIALAYLGGRGGRSHVVVSDSTGPSVASTDDTRAVLRIRYSVSCYWIIWILRYIVTPGVKAM
jgi:hypothetical protein